MHLGSLDRQVAREAASQPAQVMVWQPRRGDSRWRPRGHISLPAAAAGLPRTARLRVLGRLSLSRAAGGNAAASDRYRPVQIRRVQTQRAHHADAQPRLLEARPPVSRWYRIHNHPRPLDGKPRFRRGEARLDRDNSAVVKGHQEPGARRDLRGDPGRDQPQPDHQPRCACRGRSRALP